MVRIILMCVGIILGLGYLAEGLLCVFFIGIGDKWLSILGFFMILPFVVVGFFWSRLGGVLLIFASLFSLIAVYEIYNGNFQSLILCAEQFGCPIMLLGICFLIVGIRVKKESSK